MTDDEQIIIDMARAMAKSVNDPEWSHYKKPAAAALGAVKAYIEKKRAGE